MKYWIYWRLFSKEILFYDFHLLTAIDLLKWLLREGRLHNFTLVLVFLLFIKKSFKCCKICHDHHESLKNMNFTAMEAAQSKTNRIISSLVIHVNQKKRNFPCWQSPPPTFLQNHKPQDSSTSKQFFEVFHSVDDKYHPAFIKPRIIFQHAIARDEGTKWWPTQVLPYRPLFKFDSTRLDQGGSAVMTFAILHDYFIIFQNYSPRIVFWFRILKGF